MSRDALPLFAPQIPQERREPAGGAGVPSDVVRRLQHRSGPFFTTKNGARDRDYLIVETDEGRFLREFEDGSREPENVTREWVERMVRERQWTEVRS